MEQVASEISMLGEREIEWRDILTSPFEIHGFYDGEGMQPYRRMPLDIELTASKELMSESTGGRVRFSTDSPYIAIRAKFSWLGRAAHYTLTGAGGFDLYIDGEYGSRFVNIFALPYNTKDGYEQVVELKGERMRSYTVNFPVRAIVESVQVGLKPGASVGAPMPYRSIDPITFYGSSIVHGVTASRPGCTYPSIVARELNVDFRNIGLAGNAKGEAQLSEWLSTLPTSVFVCDYDHNTNSSEHLEQTHYRFYEVYREKNPDTPYIMVTAPDYWPRMNKWESLMRHRDIIMTSYLKARSLGDRNVYFIDGMSFNMGAHQYETTVDSIHPNDVGYLRMADNIGAVIKHALEKKDFD